MSWATYVDPRFGFTVDYPAHWEVIPRDDAPGHVGGMVIFKEPVGHGGGGRGGLHKVDLGFYLVEREDSMPLDEWSERYRTGHSIPGLPQPRVLRASVDRIPTGACFRKEAESDLTPYTLVNVAHGGIVWFMWTNANEGQQLGTFNHMVRSLRFTGETPLSLQQAYGLWFEPDALERVKPPAMPDGTVTIQSLTGYRVPVRVSVPVLCGDTNSPQCLNECDDPEDKIHVCGTHNGASEYAIDIGVGIGTPVYNSVESWYNGSGYDDTGRGLWLSVWDTARNYVAYHFHLQSIDYQTFWTHEHDGFPVPQGDLIAYSGDSGMGGAHLHYHVQTTGGAAVPLTGMQGLWLDVGGNYPNCLNDPEARLPENCGNDVYCFCGYVN